MLVRVTARESFDPYYDLFEDWDLIVSSFLTQYGLRIRTGEFKTVSWDEFCSLLSGIAPDTPLGRIVTIRAETDREVIKNFKNNQKQIYDEWRQRKADSMSQETYKQQMKSLEKLFEQLCK